MAEHEITVIEGGCPCLFSPAADPGHKVMRFICTLTGHTPRQVQGKTLWGRATPSWSLSCEVVAGRWQSCRLSLRGWAVEPFTQDVRLHQPLLPALAASRDAGLMIPAAGQATWRAIGPPRLGLGSLWGDLPGS
jgi:hypothetical protein